MDSAAEGQNPRRAIQFWQTHSIIFQRHKGVYCFAKIPGSHIHHSKASQTFCRKKESKKALSATTPSTSFVISEIDQDRIPGVMPFPPRNITQSKLGFPMGVSQRESSRMKFFVDRKRARFLPLYFWHCDGWCDQSCNLPDSPLKDTPPLILLPLFFLSPLMQRMLKTEHLPSFSKIQHGSLQLVCGG